MAYIFDLSDAWTNGATTFTAIKMNVTDGGSTAGSLLMDLQTGGVSRFSVSKTGAVTTPGSLNAGVDIYWTRDLYALSGTSRITWTGGLSLHQDAANTLAQRNSTNPQAFNLYNTYSTVSDYERGFMRFVSNVLQIGTEKNGTSMFARSLVFQTDGVTRMTIGAAGGITFNSMAIQNGNFYVSADGNQIAVGGSFGVTTGGEQGPIIYNGGHLGWFSGTITTSGQVPDLRLYRDAADNLAQRRGTNAQTSRLYGTYTDAFNYRRLTKTMSTAGVAEIKPEGAGTGASGNVLHISGLPTANPGPGILWNNAGTPAIGT